MKPNEFTKGPSPKTLELVEKSYRMRQKYWPSYTWEIQTKYLNDPKNYSKNLAKKCIDLKAFSKNKASLFNKINSSFYHLQRLKENERKITSLGRSMAKESRKKIEAQVLGIIGTPYEPIEYEYEAILVTLKSSLDIFSTIISDYLNLKVDNIASLLNNVEQSKDTNKSIIEVKNLLNRVEYIKIIEEFQNNKKDNTPSKRNYGVHKGSLPTQTINIQFAKRTKKVSILKTGLVEINNTPLPTKRTSLEDYATNTFYSTCDLIIEGLELLLGKHLPKGEKCSVYVSRKKSMKR